VVNLEHSVERSANTEKHQPGQDLWEHSIGLIDKFFEVNTLNRIACGYSLEGMLLVTSEQIEVPWVDEVLFRIGNGRFLQIVILDEQILSRYIVSYLCTFEYFDLVSLTALES